MDGMDITPEEYQQLIALGGQNTDLLNAITAQKAQADRLRSEAPELRGDGRVQRAPHILEYLGNFAKNNVAQKMDKQNIQRQTEMGANSQAQNQMVLQQILRAQRQPPQMQQMPAAPQGMGNPYSQFLRGGT